MCAKGDFSPPGAFLAFPASLYLFIEQKPPGAVSLRSTACSLPAAIMPHRRAAYILAFCLSAHLGGYILRRLSLCSVFDMGYLHPLKMPRCRFPFPAAFGSSTANKKKSPVSLLLLCAVYAVCCISRRFEHKQPARAATVALLYALAFIRCVLRRLYHTKTPA